MQTSQVLVVGAENLPSEPPLFGPNKRFHESLFIRHKEADQLELHFARDEPLGKDPTEGTPFERACKTALRDVEQGKYDAALLFPPDFDEKLENVRQAIENQAKGLKPDPKDKTANHFKVPSPQVIYTTANERSPTASNRLAGVLGRWSEKVGQNNLSAGGVPLSAAKPFIIEADDRADNTGQEGVALWSKLFPVLLLIWAMTGAFYPAVDLCAGEKERGTLETLLCSPAERSEIVIGKLFTVMVFSMITAALNLATLGLTGWLVASKIPGMAPPPPMAAVWAGIALIPVAALFSALCLALAAFAKSTKEGQYYLMPLLLVTMPLAIMPMSSAVELNLGTSLIPITGVVLLLRSALEGNYLEALQYSPIVIVITLLCCMLSIRWAIDQFNSESVLFRESEQLDVGLWLRHLSRDRGATPTVSMAMFCGVIILVARFFMTLVVGDTKTFGDIAVQTLVIQLALIALPVLLMTFLFTSNRRLTLLIKTPRLAAIGAAMLLAVVLHPVMGALGASIQKLYPISPEVVPQLVKIHEMVMSAPMLWTVLLLALLPAVCEELAFRGFILSGFRHLGHKWRAIIYSAVFFGIAHSVLQQSISACLLGIVIGFLAVQSNSLLPCVTFHFVHNSLALLSPRLMPKLVERYPDLLMFLEPIENGAYTYTLPTVVAGGAAGVVLLIWFALLQCPRSIEEQLQEAIVRGLAREEAEDQQAALIAEAQQAAEIAKARKPRST
jgi:sodium transport system permease protein